MTFLGFLWKTWLKKTCLCFMWLRAHSVWILFSAEIFSKKNYQQLFSIAVAWGGDKSWGKQQVNQKTLKEKNEELDANWGLRKSQTDSLESRKSPCAGLWESMFSPLADLESLWKQEIKARQSGKVPAWMYFTQTHTHTHVRALSSWAKTGKFISSWVLGKFYLFSE